MSKKTYVWRTKGHLIKAGWDNPLQSYYAQVWPYPTTTRDLDIEPRMEAWFGVEMRQYDTVTKLAKALAPYSAIPMEIEAAMERDGSLRTPRTPLQVRIGELLAHASGRS